MSFLFVFSFVFCLIFKIPLNKFNDNYYNGVSKKKKKKPFEVYPMSTSDTHGIRYMHKVIM